MTAHEFARYLLEKCPDIAIYVFDHETWELDEVLGCLLFSEDGKASPRLIINQEGKYLFTDIAKEIK